MQELIERIRERLSDSAYFNEAAISHGVVMPVLAALGWDTSDPAQVKPEFAIERGRVDFALVGLGSRPAVFVEVKAVGRAIEADRQLFRYAFDEGVPLCVLTDGREWSFYLPSGQGSFNDRRLYRLQLDERDPAECEAILVRYLNRHRVRDGSAFEDAQRDLRNARMQREAAAAIPNAWSELVTEQDPLLIEMLVEKTEAVCGYRPDETEVLTYLRGLSSSAVVSAKPIVTEASDATVANAAPTAKAAVDRSISYRLFGQNYVAPTASTALVDILTAIAPRAPDKITDLADMVRTRARSHIGRSPAEINPARPDLARAVEFSPGWMVGLTISNSDKMRIIRAAANVFGLTAQDLTISLPNA